MSRPYVVAAAVTWSYSWLIDQNLAAALARRHSVLYLEPPVSPLTPLRGIGDKATDTRTLLRRRPRPEGDLSAFRPLALPRFERPLPRRLSLPGIRRQIRRAAHAVDIERPILVTLRPWPGIRGAAGEALHVHFVTDWLEAGAELLGRPRAELAAEVDAACSDADLICGSSPAIVEELRRRGHEAVLLRHGFHDDLRELYGGPEPPEYADLPRPLLGYAGTIDDRLDFDLLAELARRFSAGTLVLIGPLGPRLPRERLEPLEALQNVRFLGRRDRTALPAYLSHLDCSLMPYVEDEWARYGSPLKLWDYLYAGAPIVGSGYLDLENFAPHVLYARGNDAFGETVVAAVAAGRAGAAERQEFALTRTWDVRAAELDALVDEYLDRH